MDEINKVLDGKNNNIVNRCAEVMEILPRQQYLRELNKRKEIEKEALSLERIQTEKQFR